MSWADAIAQFGGDLFAYQGQVGANETNREIAREQMAFQERMSNTAVQRRMADLDKAGINPIIAGMSEASSPAGASANMQNPSAHLSDTATKALGLAQMKQNIKNAKEENTRIKEEAALMRNNANTAYENMIQARMMRYWLEGDQKHQQGQVNFNRMQNALLSQNVAQAQMYNNMLPHSANQAAYSRSGIGKGLTWFGMGARDLGPAVIGATGAAGASAYFRRKAAKQFQSILGGGLSQ